LYLPQFSFNLIYVPNFTQSIKCQLIFENDKCIIKDTYSQKINGAAEVKYGLYMLTEPLVSHGQVPSFICNNVVSVFDINKHYSIRHMRLEHSSLDKLVEINKIIPFVFVNKYDSPCDTYFYAKQKLFSF